MSVFALAGLVLSLWVGRGLKRRGLWPYLVAAFALFAAGEALALVAPARGGLMLAARALEGVGFTVCAIAGPLLANMNASPAQLPLVTGLTATWIPIGQVSANVLSLPVVGDGLWRPLWWVGLALTAALAAWAFVLRRAGRAATDTRRTADPATAATSGPERRALAVGGAIFGLWSGQYFAYMTWLPQFLVETHGMAADAAVLAYTVPAAAVLVLCVATGAALRAGAPLAPLFVGSIAVQVAVWGLAPLTAGGWLGALSLLAYGLTAGITPVCLFAMPSAVLGPRRVEAGAFGIIMTGRNLGVLVGPVALAGAVAAAGDWRLVWPLFGGLTFVAMVLAAVLSRRLKAWPRPAAQGTRR